MLHDVRDEVDDGSAWKSNYIFFCEKNRTAVTLKNEYLIEFGKANLKLSRSVCSGMTNKIVFMILFMLLYCFVQFESLKDYVQLSLK